MLEVLDFDVVRVPLVTKGTHENKFKDLETTKEAVVRQDNSNILGIVGKDYKLIHHKEVLNSFISSIVDISKFKIAGIALPKDGARMIARIQFPDLSIDLGNNDSLIPEIIVKNSMDGLERFSIRLGAYREKTSAIFVIGKTFNTKSRKHTQSLDMNRMANDVMFGLDIIKNNIFPKYKNMSIEIVDVDEWVEIAGESKTVPKFIFTEALKGKSGTMSKWNIYNDISYYLTHKYIDSKKSSEERAFEINENVADMFGV